MAVLGNRAARRPATGAEEGAASSPSTEDGGRQARRYQFLELLGRGGMGEVYRGRAFGFGGFEKIVAIKRLRPELGFDPHFVDRLVGEAKLLVALQHSNVVAVLDLGRWDDEVFIVLEYVDGPSLHNLLQAGRDEGRGPLSLGLVSYIAQAACAGIDFAHSLPGGAVVHADLSPANVLLTRAGEIKVADFGIARRAGGTCRASAIEGKWPYMAPEQVRAEPLTPQSDVFAMGAVLYEMATGQRAFAGEDAREVREAILGGAVTPPREHRPDMPPAFERACQRALAHAPEERFRRMRDLGAALRGVSFAEGWRHGADDLSALIRQWMPRRTPTEEELRQLLGHIDIDGKTLSATKATAPARRPRAVDLTGTIVEHRGRTGDGLARWGRRSLPKPSRLRRAALVAIAALGMATFVWALLGTGAPVVVGARVPFASGARPAPPPATARPATAARASARAPAPPIGLVREPAQPAPAPAPARRRARRGSGTLRIHSTPGAYVRVDDGARQHETPAVLRLPSGRHRLSLHNPEALLTRTVDVRVSPGETRTLSIELDSP